MRSQSERLSRDASAEPHEAPWKRTLPTILVLVILGSTITGCGGCGGCGSGSTSPAERQEAARKKAAEELKKKKEKEPLSIDPRLAVLPTDDSGGPVLKRGHWAVANQSMIANRDDFLGRLDLKIVNKDGRPIAIDRTPFRIPSSRPVSLGKGRKKKIETTFFTPMHGDPPWLDAELNQRGGMMPFRQPRVKARLMPAYQYHFVVLAKNPARYTYIKTLDSVSMPNGGAARIAVGDGEESYAENKDIHYRVVLPTDKKQVPLPDHCLLWSTVAYILWDDMEPDRLSLDQRQAMIDWLHWGGQLIVSGPGSLDMLKSSFLGPYLPADDGGATKIEQETLDVLNRSWLPSETSLKNVHLMATQPWSGIVLRLRPESRIVPRSAKLLADRRVGRGRIVVTAFRLDVPDFIHWKSIHGFYNSCLMQRPRRKWTYHEYAQLNWADLPDRRLDARLTSGLRFFSRDAGLRTNFQKMTHTADDPAIWPGMGGFQGPPEEHWVPPDAGRGGVAAWTDFNASANAARETLRIAAGVTVPKAGFILGVLAVYLIFLVPINGLFFHAIGRVEWAWIAAPIIALAGTLVVVWQAQLDIGFVRARTDIAIVEIQPSHPRAHVTRFTALYTSLGTTYDFRSENTSSLIQPFPTRANFELIKNQTYSDVVFRKHQDVQLLGFHVSSNSTNMVRSEQMIGLEGAVQLGTNSLGHPQIINRSQWDLVDVAIVERSRDSKQLTGCWIGPLKTGTSSTVQLEPITNNPPFRREREQEARSRIADTVLMEPLMQLALRETIINPGETRLVGRIDGILPGLEITPSGSQVRGAAIVIAHLRHGALRTPQPDINYHADIERLEPLGAGGEYSEADD